MRRVILFSLIWSSLTTNLTAQNQQVSDSIKQRLNSQELISDSVLYRLYLDLGFYDPNPIEALQNSKNALSIAENMNNDLFVAQAFELIAANHRIIGNKEDSFHASFKSLSIYDSLNMPEKEASMLLQIGTQYSADENYAEAISFLRRSLDITLNIGQNGGENYIMINLGETYRLMGQLDSAQYYNELVLNSEAAKTDEVIRAYTQGNNGMVLKAQGDFATATPLLKSAIEALTGMGDLYSVSVYQADLGQLYIKEGKRNQGLNMIREALSIALDQGLKEQIRDFSEMLSEYYAGIGDYAKAYPHQLRFAAYRDSLVNADNIRQIAETRYGYELDKKEQEVSQLALENELQEARLSTSNTRLLLFIILAISLLILALLLYFGYKRKKAANQLLSTKNQVIEEQSAQKELLHRELHHRVKNNLHLIKSIMSLQSGSAQEPAVAQAMKEGKSRVEALMLIHQNLYKQENVTEVNLKDYLEKLRENMLVSYPADIAAITVEAEDVQIGTDDIIPMGLCINEAVTNAAKHRGKDAVSIDISFTKQKEGYQLSIADNGPGGLESNSKEGFGTQLIKTLAQQLRAELSIESNLRGTKMAMLLGHSIVNRNLQPVA